MDLDHGSMLIEKGLTELINEGDINTDIYLEKGEYTRLDFYVYDDITLNRIINKFKFKSIGSIFDYPSYLPQPGKYTMFDLETDIDKIFRICISEKYSAVMLYSYTKYTIKIFILIDVDNVRKFNSKLKSILDAQSRLGIFSNVDFKCSKNEYIEIKRPTHEDKYISVQKKKVLKEQLVFDKDSELFNVLTDIKTFFEPETKKLYEKMGILYKRGAILHGDPGNGKSAMLREIIRQVQNVTKVIISADVPNIPLVLDDLIDNLNGKPSIIIIEDIDTVIGPSNKSQFLNILDGVDIRSGAYLVATTNHLERIDPAFVNRPGRFDRDYKINNPSDTLRHYFFMSRNVNELFKDYKIHSDSTDNGDLSVLELFVKHSEGLSMSNLKELMLAVQYTVIGDSIISIEDALVKSAKTLIESKEEHVRRYNDAYRRPRTLPRKFEEYDDDEE